MHNRAKLRVFPTCRGANTQTSCTVPWHWVRGRVFVSLLSCDWTACSGCHRADERDCPPRQGICLIFSTQPRLRQFPGQTRPSTGVQHNFALLCRSHPASQHETPKKRTLPTVEWQKAFSARPWTSKYLRKWRQPLIIVFSPSCRWCGGASGTALSRWNDHVFWFLIRLPENKMQHSCYNTVQSQLEGDCAGWKDVLSSNPINGSKVLIQHFPRLQQIQITSDAN